MTTTVVQHAPIVLTSAPPQPRLSLAPTRAARAVLDGGWWPRSRDPVAEVPGLVLALTAHYGPIRQMMLHSGGWDGRFRRLAVGPGVVRFGWFTSLDPALVIATTYSGDQIDLLVVPPQTPAAAATLAMATAADPTNTVRASQILAAMTAARSPAPEQGADPVAVWDNEGGHAPEAGPDRRPGQLFVATSS
jgi:Family of unknown function (DUF5994)